MKTVTATIVLIEKFLPDSADKAKTAKETQKHIDENGIHISPNEEVKIVVTSVKVTES